MEISHSYIAWDEEIEQFLIALYVKGCSIQEMVTLLTEERDFQTNHAKVQDKLKRLQKQKKLARRTSKWEADAEEFLMKCYNENRKFEKMWQEFNSEFSNYSREQVNEKIKRLKKQKRILPRTIQGREEIIVKHLSGNPGLMPKVYINKLNSELKTKGFEACAPEEVQRKRRVLRARFGKKVE